MDQEILYQQYIQCKVCTQKYTRSVPPYPTLNVLLGAEKDPVVDAIVHSAHISLIVKQFIWNGKRVIVQA